MKLKITINKIKKSPGRFSARQKLIFIVLAAVIALAVVYSAGILMKEDPSSKDQDPKPTTLPREEIILTGGDPNLVVSYHEQAIAAWKAGDKEKAKELATKGLELNDQLTTDQQAQIPSQSDVMFELYDISKGSYEGS